ncbi:MAG: hypothetical protein V3T83_11060 [Acidobacteriota bacterium]
MIRTERLFPLPLALLLALPFAFSAAAPQKLTSFSRTGRFTVEVDGKLDPKARVYHSPQPPAFLIRSPGLVSDYVLHPRTYQVVSLDRRHASEEVDGKVSITPGYSTGPAGKFLVGSDQTVSMEADGHRIRLLPKADLLGFRTGAEIFEYDYKYVERARDYQPDAVLVAEMKASSKQAQLTVYFGSWCPNCQQNVPKTLRLEQELEGSNLGFTYYGIPKAPKFSQDPEVQEHNIERVPTGILRANNREVGRIQKDDWNRLEGRIAELLSRVK